MAEAVFPRSAPQNTAVNAGNSERDSHRRALKVGKREVESLGPGLGERQRQGVLGPPTRQERVVHPWLPTRWSGNKRPSAKASSPGMPWGSLWQHGASQHHQQRRQTASLPKNKSQGRQSPSHRGPRIPLSTQRIGMQQEERARGTRPQQEPTAGLSTPQAPGSPAPRNSGAAARNWPEG